MLRLQLRRLGSSGKVFGGLDTFVRRHIGPNEGDVKEMLKVVKKDSLEQFIDAVIPEPIRYKKAIFDNGGRTETEMLDEMKAVLSQNKTDITSLIGLGYYNTKTPHVILRNLLENPGWYTPYTPYQAEISQGRLESLLNFQTMIIEMTGLPVANASLLDEGTAAGEIVGVVVQVFKGARKKIFVDKNVFPQTIAVIKTRADGFKVAVEVGDWKSFKPTSEYGAVIVQYPDGTGQVNDYSAFFEECGKHKVVRAVAADLLSLAVLRPPAEFGADFAVGSTQRFGVPLGFGGPHAAFMACKDEYKRQLPGRIIGVSRDVNGKRAFRMALQTREQHIKREKATSNICTAQALLANTAVFYAIYHGPQGIKQIASEVHTVAKAIAAGFTSLGHVVKTSNFFDTVQVELKGITATQFVIAAEELGVNVLRVNDHTIQISTDEVTEDVHIQSLLQAAGGKNKTDLKEVRKVAETSDKIGKFQRTSAYLTHPVFNSFHCEHELMRYLFKLQMKDLGMNLSMIPLGSCTMKLNSATEMIPVTWKENGRLHPFAPASHTIGSRKMIELLEERLIQITGFDKFTFQPNSGAQGEYAGLRTIQAYHQSLGQGHRNIALIPVSAHGTNPATAALCGMKIVVVNVDKQGNIDFADLKAKAEANKDNLSVMMITYPSTYGIFEEGIKQATDLIHSYGGQVYIDGANFNAQMFLTRPGDYGGDVSHLNMHKTFCIPHGGGGPGMGPIGVKAHLAPFLPTNPVSPAWTSGSKPFGSVSASEFGSPSILPICYSYIEMMNGRGLQYSSEIAILNANYIAYRLKDEYKLLFVGSSGYTAHECIIDIRPFEKTAGVVAEDVAKRLMDYGLHAPTLSFPVAGTLMIEPTESESKNELDRLINALLSIRQEIREIEEGKADKKNNLLKNSPHTAEIIAGAWDRPYSRERAAYPTTFQRNYKFWPTVSRIDGAYGDKNFVCECPPMEYYTKTE